MWLDEFHDIQNESNSFTLSYKKHLGWYSALMTVTLLETLYQTELRSSAERRHILTSLKLKEKKKRITKRHTTYEREARIIMRRRQGQNMRITLMLLHKHTVPIMLYVKQQTCLIFFKRSHQTQASSIAWINNSFLMTNKEIFMEGY